MLSIRARGAGALALTTILFCTTACSYLGGGSDVDTGGKTLIKVGAMQLLNLVPLNVAADPAYHLFGDEGLFIKPVTIDKGNAGLLKLLNGEADITYVSIVSAGKAQAAVSDVKDTSKRYTIIAPASANAESTLALIVKENGPIKTVRDLKGKRIAINQSGGLADALARSALINNGVNPNEVTWVPGVNFEDIPKYLAQGQFEAAIAAEPYVTQSAKIAGAIPLVNFQNHGETQDLPLDCYATTEKYANEHPAEIAGFRRALRNAASLAHLNPQVAIEEVPRFIENMPADQASLLHYPAYPLALNTVGYQRVPDFLTLYGLAPKFDIGPMIYKGPPSPAPSGATATPTSK